MGLSASPWRRPMALAWLLVAALTALRLLVLAVAAPPLSFDEAQYWIWAQHFQLGYYSKPPMVAWAIAATTALFGEGEGAVKMGATLAQAACALLVGRLGLRLFGETVGAWACALWATMPAVSLSAMMITTDPFLLVFWAAALVALAEISRLPPDSRRWWALLGLAFGLGLLAKYAMAFFLLGLAVWLATEPAARALARQRGLWLAIALGLAVYAPNLIWNAVNGFVSYAHTADNANLGGRLFHADKLAEFLGGQLGVFGPLTFLSLLAALAAAWRRTAPPQARLLASFVLPVLAVMTVQAFLSRANANWTAPAYVAGTVLAVWFLLGRGRWGRRVLTASLALHLGVGVAILALEPGRALLGLADRAAFDPMKRIKGWPELGQRVSDLLAAHPGATLLADERKVIATLVYYVRPHPFDAVKWNPGGRIHDHFDQTSVLRPGPGPWLLVTEDGATASLLDRFESAQRLETIRIPLYKDYDRTADVWLLSGFKGY